MNYKLNFKPKARILLQLGDQLIRNESIALLEIIKNSYDADASKVTVSMKSVEDPSQGEIIIEDDGEGMDRNIIENVWMQPGSNYKQKKIENEEVSKKFKRLPIGEKGIGRFGAHKLGNIITLISRKEGEKEIVLKINWQNFEKDSPLSKIFVQLRERTPELFKNKTGTRIEIKKLKSKWERGKIRDLYRAINSLNSPFKSSSSFNVIFKLDKPEWLTGLISFKEIQQYALYFAESLIEGKEIKVLLYKFNPWDTMGKLNSRKEIFRKINMVKVIKNPITKKKESKDIDLSKFDIGKINFRLMIFDRDPKLLSLGVTDKKGFKDYLDENGGIRIFRNDIRVYDYGERDNDWLELDIRRVNSPGHAISNNLIIGAINLSRKDSLDLEEKTNREGFIENEAYNEFKDAINFTLDKIITQRNLDKEKIRKFYSSSSVAEPVTGKLKILFDSVEKNVKDPELKKELLQTIKDTEKDFEQISEIYTRSSNAGLSLGIVIHELEKVVDELIRTVEKYPKGSHLRVLVNHLSKIIEDYSTVIKYSPKQKEDLKEIVNQAIFNLTFRIKAHNMHISKPYSGRSNTIVKCSSALVISTLMNLIDNSIWWINYAKRRKKMIYIDILDDYEGYTSILFADNGPGFSIPPESAVKPFITDKPGGMGLGLHLADEVMKAQKGKLIFPEWGDVYLPKDYKEGAKIILAFKI